MGVTGTGGVGILGWAIGLPILRQEAGLIDNSVQWQALLLVYLARWPVGGSGHSTDTPFYNAFCTLLKT